jgi:thioredoxin reductase (NADPH)
MIDLLIVGAGPAGLSCAIAAHHHNLKYVILEKGNIVNAIINFPVNMTFFSTSDLLELAEIPFTSAGFRPTRQEVVRYYHNLASHFKLTVQSNTMVRQVKPVNGHFEILAEQHDQKKTIEAASVVLATGFYDNPNRLNIPGEDLAHVSHYYREAFPYFGQDVVIVGGKNSAVEAALELFRSGANVTMIHRRPEIRESVKYWILPDIQNRIKEGSIKAFFNAGLKKIGAGFVELSQNGEISRIPADAVFILTGYHPDTGLFESAGIHYDPESLVPEFDSGSHESNIPGLYLAGSLVAGKNHNLVFIENSREHGGRIVDAILAKQS